MWYTDDILKVVHSWSGEECDVSVLHSSSVGMWLESYAAREVWFTDNCYDFIGIITFHHKFKDYFSDMIATAEGIFCFSCF